MANASRCSAWRATISISATRGHAPVVRATLHVEGSLIDPETGQQILRARSGGAPRIAEFELADGTVTAVGVGYPGISREPVVLGP
jgi:hypothetical protein